MSSSESRVPLSERWCPRFGLQRSCVSISTSALSGPYRVRAGGRRGSRVVLCRDEDTRPLGLAAGPDGKPIVVHGLGNVGYHVGTFLDWEGSRVIGTLEREGAIYDPGGLDPEKVRGHRAGGGSSLGLGAEVKLPAPGYLAGLER